MFSVQDNINQILDRAVLMHGTFKAKSYLGSIKSQISENNAAAKALNEEMSGANYNQNVGVDGKTVETSMGTLNLPGYHPIKPGEVMTDLSGRTSNEYEQMQKFNQNYDSIRTKGSESFNRDYKELNVRDKNGVNRYGQESLNVRTKGDK